MVEPVKKWLARHDVTLHLGARAKAFEKTRDGGVLTVATKDGKELKLEGDKILVTVGRKPNTDGWGLENMAVDMDGRFVKVDDQCRTSMKNVWAIGDLVGEPMLEHKAAKQGDMVAEIIAGQKRRFDPASIPAVCFTEPEVVSAGLLPTDAAAKNQEIITGMSRTRFLYVIARNSTLRYRDRTKDVRQIGSELDVRYLLDGSVQRQSAVGWDKYA